MLLRNDTAPPFVFKQYKTSLVISFTPFIDGPFSQTGGQWKDQFAKPHGNSQIYTHVPKSC